MISKKERQAILEGAERFFRAGKLREAVREYERLQEADVLDINLANIIGDLYVRLGKTGKGIEQYLKVASHYEAKGQYSQCLASYRKISKVKPDDIPTAIKLAELYALLGFVTEAKNGFQKIVDRLEKERHVKGLIFVLEKMVKLDRTDPRIKRRLAELYIREGSVDDAVDILNEAAEIKLDRQDLKEAEEILGQANQLKKGHLRTALNYVELMKRRGRRAEAIVLAEENLRHHPDNLDLLSHLGGLYLEEKLFRKAEEIFSRMYEHNPNDINTRVRLGYAYIQLNKLDRGYDLYEPLVNTLLSKNREDKAIGLLGQLVMGKEVYLPALEKLSVIFKSRNQKANLEAALRILLQEYRRKDMRQKALVVLRELIDLCPGDPVLAREFAQSGGEAQPPSSSAAARQEGGARLTAKDRETIRVNLSKAELYLQQGLALNAKRILENLLLLYPEDREVRSRLESLRSIAGPASREAIPHLVEKAAVMEQKAARARKTDARPLPDLRDKEQVSSGDVFDGLDSLARPMAFDESLFPDVTDILAEELALIEAATFQQQKKATALVENELSDIIRDFRKDVEQKLKPSNLEVRYSLGMAFYEQELYEEAAEEFKKAAEDEKRRVDCYNLISLCYRARKDYVQALDWLNKALSLVKEGSRKSFVLKYELGTLFEEMEQKDKALGMFSEVKSWNPQFRNVTRRIRTLKTSAG